MSSSSTQKSHKIPPQMLQHLQYLRGLYLDAPKIGNTFLQDTALRQYITPIIGQNKQFVSLLIQVGDKFSNKYLIAARNAQQNAPRLQQFNSYGQRIDKLHLAQGWQHLKKYSAQDGIVALAYQQDKYHLGQFQRFGQLINLYMYHPSAGLFGCPLSMTDGAAYTIKYVLQHKKCQPSAINILTNAFTHLTSRTDMWTSGQWMTQKKGGSDVTNTQTVAIKQQGSNFYRLYGYKWFTSATDSHMSLGLAKILPTNIKPTVQNLKNIKVSLFFMRVKQDDGTLNNIEVIRLKDKLGTRQVPTSQLLLKGSVAYLISQPQKGTKTISKMLSITRMHNAAMAVGLMRKGLSLARDYAQRRIIGKTTLSNMPLHLRVLSHLDVIHRGSLIMFIKLSYLFSKQQYKSITPHESNILRIMLPLIKLFTAKQALLVSTQILESFGGMGYIQSSMLPSILRDAQALSIWEGTTNTLCYDFLRAIRKKQNQFLPLQSLHFHFTKFLQQFKQKTLTNNKHTQIYKKIKQSYTKLFTDINQAIKNNFNGYLSQLRSYCFGLSRIFIAVELTTHMLSTQKPKDISVVQRWINIGLYVREQYDNKLDKQLGMDVNQRGLTTSGGDFDSRGFPRSRL